MGPEHALPLPSGYKSEAAYVDDLLGFVASTDVLKLLVGGVHILDFFTRSPDLYQCLLPSDWRLWFEKHDLSDLLDFFLRQDLSLFAQPGTQWRGKPAPPSSLVSYLAKIRSLSLRRDFHPSSLNDALDGLVATPEKSTIPRQVVVGMKQKKIHEVDHFARYIHKLTLDVEAYTGRQISHVVDFGSGQNYLGRTLASQPYNKHVVAVERRHANVQGAKAMDIHAKLAPRTRIWRNKKEWRAQQDAAVHLEHAQSSFSMVESPSSISVARGSSNSGSIQYVEHELEDGNLDSVIAEATIYGNTHELPTTQAAQRNHLEEVSTNSPNLMVISLHSCGNLTHHGLRALALNPSVSAVALVGCCYNLVTERLTAPSYKLPNLRPSPAPSEPPPSRISPADSSTTNPPPLSTPNPTHITSPFHKPHPPQIKGDPHGYPMSARLAASGITLNITARMMAVQAPHNWTAADSAAFFRRHYYRALLQRIFVDRGVVTPPADASALSSAERRAAYIAAADSNVIAGGNGGAAQPVVIGSLRKACYVDFVAYVRGAVEKLCGAGDGARDEQGEVARLVHERVAPMADAEFQAYAEAYAAREKDLSIVWSLMALSATLVEAVIVVDRWLWLREQMAGAADGYTKPPAAERKCRATDGDEKQEARVTQAWVESVFDYSWSPRNLVVVGVKR